MRDDLGSGNSGPSVLGQRFGEEIEPIVYRRDPPCQAGNVSPDSSGEILTTPVFRMFEHGRCAIVRAEGVVRFALRPSVVRASAR